MKTRAAIWWFFGSWILIGLGILGCFLFDEPGKAKGEVCSLVIVCGLVCTAGLVGLMTFAFWFTFCRLLAAALTRLQTKTAARVEQDASLVR